MAPCTQGRACGERSNSLTLPFTGERCVPGVTPHEVFDQHASRYRFAARTFRPDSAILDVGSGSGIGASLFSSNYPSVVGIELDAPSVAFARRRYATSASNLSFVRGDAQCLPLADETFDGATLFEVIEHVPEPARVLNEIRRVLRPNGLLLASTPAGEFDRFLENPYHISRFSREDFRSAVLKYFDVEAEHYQGIITKRQLMSARWQAHLRRYGPSAVALRALLALWPPSRRQSIGQSADEFAARPSGIDSWPVTPMVHLTAGTVPYIIVIQCRRR